MHDMLILAVTDTLRVVWFEKKKFFIRMLKTNIIRNYLIESSSICGTYTVFSNSFTIQFLIFHLLKSYRLPVFRYKVIYSFSEFIYFIMKQDFNHTPQDYSKFL